MNSTTRTPGEHPNHETPHNWAWQVRMLGEDRRAAYQELAKVRQDLERAQRPAVA
jgi:hypothetical protein